MIKPCPCGQIPKDLHIEEQASHSKFAYVTGDCCVIWQIEFRLDYKDPSSEEGAELALEAWNMAQRGNSSTIMEAMRVKQMAENENIKCAKCSNLMIEKPPQIFLCSNPRQYYSDWWCACGHTENHGTKYESSSMGEKVLKDAWDVANGSHKCK